MSKSTYDYLLTNLTEHIMRENTSLRMAIPPEEMLVVTLRALLHWSRSAQSGTTNPVPIRQIRFDPPTLQPVFQPDRGREMRNSVLCQLSRSADRGFNTLKFV
ncbi:hypothetical protein J6590_083928 [Homalodisca vitripennis]|nr:hypothetical protein J6590_083928 [Homalodisca vitripennis]